MEKIKLNNIFNLSKEEINNCKIELNMSEGRNGQLYIDKWLSLSEKEKQSGINDCSYWPKYGSQSNFHVGQKVFSFVRKSYDEWLFISAATILDVPENRRSNVEILEKYKPLFGRLIMKFHKGNTMGRYTFNLSYLNNKEEVIENFNLSVGEKQSVALVGKTGSGKTSLVNLLCRFYEIQEGKILINREDYRTYSMESLRKRIGYVMQQVVLFEGTVLDNINYAKEVVDKTQIIQICKELQLHDKIMQLPNGYETKLTPDTDILSAGEKQLLNFARVMLQNPDVVILDEVTASLSYPSEMLIRSAIEKITKNRISFIIAHRLSTIQSCDKIVLLQKGNILEEGNHEELMKLQGAYCEMIKKQYA